jgi:hypothetical protein
MSLNLNNFIGSIGAEAFRDCSNLASALTLNTITSIGFLAFRGCTKLTSLDLNSYTGTIESDAFQNCTSLTFNNITLPPTGLYSNFNVINNSKTKIIYKPGDNSHSPYILGCLAFGIIDTTILSTLNVVYARDLYEFSGC